ncbi:MAG TPA: PAS domain-containing protein, partial [Gemmatimonadaceae bacterium]|nr:PAS domain-containing protein [Gemmatimonadaceae bacterium]
MLLAGTGEMRERVRELDLASTSVGAMEEWPQSFRTAVDLALASAFPTVVLWGPELIQIYNDAYRRIMGAKHPRGLGRPTREIWPEVWHINGPIYERVLAGETISLENARYPLERGSEVEDVYLTISFSPLRDDDGAIAGVFLTMLETTSGVLAEEMQQRLLGELRVERRRLEEVFRQAPTFLAILRGSDHVFHLANDAYYQVVGHRNVVGRRVIDALPEVVAQGFVSILDGVLATGAPFVGRELPIMLERTPGAELEQRYLDFVYQPLTEADGTRVGIVAHGSDVTDQVLARRELEEANVQLELRATELRASEQRLRDVFNQAPIAIAVMAGPEHVFTIASPRYVDTPGGGRALIGRSVREAFPELVGQGFIEAMDRVYETGEPYFASERLVRLDRDHDGVTEDYFFNVGYQPLRDASGG